MQKGILSQNGAGKLALLGLFALGIGLSQILVTVRHRVELTAPIRLTAAAVSVPLPKGTAWQAHETWIYSYNEYVLSAQLSAGHRTRAFVQWRCQLATKPLDLGDLLLDLTKSSDTDILDEAQMTSGPITFQWAQLGRKGRRDDIFFAIAEVFPERRLSLRVEMPGETLAAKELFLALLDEVTIEDDSAIRRGASFVAAVKDIGASALLKASAPTPPQLIYLLSSGTEAASGFALDSYELARNGNDAYEARVTSHVFHERSGKATTLISRLESDDRFERFIWQNRYQGVAYTLERSDEGEIHLGSAVSGRDKTIHASEIMIPSPLVEVVLTHFLEGGSEPIVIDVLLAEGMILPTRIEPWPQIEPVFQDTATYAIGLELLRGQEDAVIICYFNRYREFVGKSEIREDTPLHWLISDQETVSEKFPQWRDLLNQGQDPL